MSDNCIALTSAEFRTFMKMNGIRMQLLPLSAESAMQTFKNRMSKAKMGDLNLHSAIFLFCYKITSHSTTGSQPAQASNLNLLHPLVQKKVEHSREWQAVRHDTIARNRCSSRMTLSLCLRGGKAGNIR